MGITEPKLGKWVIFIYHVVHNPHLRNKNKIVSFKYIDFEILWFIIFNSTNPPPIPYSTFALLTPTICLKWKVNWKLGLFLRLYSHKTVSFPIYFRLDPIKLSLLHFLGIDAWSCSVKILSYLVRGVTHDNMYRKHALYYTGVPLSLN